MKINLDFPTEISQKSLDLTAQQITTLEDQLKMLDKQFQANDEQSIRLEQLLGDASSSNSSRSNRTHLLITWGGLFPLAFGDSFFKENAKSFILKAIVVGMLAKLPRDYLADSEKLEEYKQIGMKFLKKGKRNDQ